MAGMLLKSRVGPIGVDIGSRSVKLLQFDADRSRLIEAARWDLESPLSGAPPKRDEQIVQALCQAREGRRFRGREAVFSLGARDLFVQNIRVPQAAGEDLRKTVYAEAAGRLPFRSEEAQIRYLETGDVRQGDTMRREVILLACRQETIERLLQLAERAGLRPAAIDVEPVALVRCYARQYRRTEDQQSRMMFVNLGASTTKVVIAQGPAPMFIKYLETGGRHFDEAVARYLEMPLEDAAALRRHNGDRRADQRDPEVTRSLGQAIRPVLERLAGEIALCLRYYSVTFRGQPLSRVVLSGGEASESLCEYLGAQLGVPCELGDPLRTYTTPQPGGRVGQWDVAAGLALRTTS